MNTTQNRNEAGIRTYGTVWATLLLLTGITVATASMNLRRVTIIVCLGIAAIKSTLVLLYFMHMRYENRLVIKVVIPIAIVALAIFIGLTFSDVLTRH